MFREQQGGRCGGNRISRGKAEAGTGGDSPNVEGLLFHGEGVGFCPQREDAVGAF